MKSWVKRESKSRPGAEYYFNTATGETRWKPPSASDKKVWESERTKQLKEDLKNKKNLLVKQANTPFLPDGGQRIRAQIPVRVGLFVYALHVEVLTLLQKLHVREEKLLQ